MLLSGGTFLDGFLGSGTSIIVGSQLGIPIEIDPHYVKLLKEHLSKVRF